jgi:hypothetical protein
VKAIASDALLFARVLIQRQRKLGERPNHIKADTDHYNCVGRVRLSLRRFDDWMHRIQQTTRNKRARNKQCYPLQNSSPHGSFLPVNHHHFKPVFALLPEAGGPTYCERNRAKPVVDTPMIGLQWESWASAYRKPRTAAYRRLC